MIHNCQELCCESIGTACYYPDSEDPAGYYCYEHASLNGFCYGCGQFWSGVEQFDFAKFWGNIEGYCPNCSDEIKADMGDEEEDDEYDEYEF